MHEEHYEYRLGGHFDRVAHVFAFDFFNTLDKHEDIRELARKFFREGHEVHIISAVSPGLPIDNDDAYTAMLEMLKVPFTKIHRVDHRPDLKVDVLLTINARAFWDDLSENVEAARESGISTCHVGVDAHSVTKRTTTIHTLWSIE